MSFGVTFRALSRRLDGACLVWVALLATPRLAAAQPPPTHVLLQGQLTDAQGKGQSGVTVSLFRKSPDQERGEPLATTTTNELGDFILTAAEAVHGEVLVVFAKPQYTTLTRELLLGEGDAAPFLGETLHGDLVVAGRVAHALTKLPVAEARTVLKTAGMEREATTDAEGRFRFSEASPGEGELIVEADAFGRERVRIAQVQAAADLLVTLKPGRIVHIRVVDEQQMPVPEVVVETLDQPRADLRQAVTDDDGQVTLGGIHFDAFILPLRLTHADYVSRATFDRQIMTPSDSAESWHEFILVRAGSVSGRITSAQSGEPLQGARIFAGDQYSEAAPRDWSDYEGRYTIGGIRPGDAILTIHLAGYAPELKQVTIKARETTALDVPLAAAAAIRGVLKTEAGDPVAGAEIAAVAWRGKPTLGLRAMSDTQGRFVIDNAPHDEFEVAVHVPNREPITRTLQYQPGSDLTLTVPDSTPRMARDPKKGPLQAGETIPDLTLRTLTGETLKLADLRGKYVLIDFWATWCLPCVEELPHFLAVKDKYGARKDFVMISISRDQEVDLVREHLQRNPKITWPQVVGDAAGVRQACEGFGVTPLPEVFLIDPQGKVVAHKLRHERIEQAVDEALSAKSRG